MRTLAMILLLLASAHATSAEVNSAVPERFVGEWNASLSDCGTANNDSRLLIEKDHITYWESDGPIKAVVSEGRYEITLILHLTGEGDMDRHRTLQTLPGRQGADFSQTSRT